MRAPDPRLAPGLVALALLAGCAGKRIAGDDEPTIASLAGRSVDVAPDRGIATSTEKTIAAYRSFLEVAPKAREVPEALRRLGDLQMDLADEKLAAGETGANGAPDYKAAIAQYEDVLKRFPKDPANDRVLYQLARAQEQGGSLETALKTLDRLVAEHPQTRYADEAQFRRGELLFTMRDWRQAEAAYATVLKAGADGPYAERALYMQGWSVFKQGRLDESLHSFLGVLDRKLPGLGDELDLAEVQGLTRADRELVEDTFRVASIALANLQGAESIAPYVTSDERRAYEFRIHQQLGELYLKQERPKDAADAFALFARRQPLHAQAPVMQARVIEIYQRNGFATLALDAKKAYVDRYGIDGEFRRANPEGWARAQPLVKTHLAELAQHHHAQAQRTKALADVDEAAKWYRAYIVSFPQDAATPQNHFLLGELLFEAQRPAEAADAYEKAAYAYPAHAKSADAGYAALLAHAEVEKRAADAGAKAAAQRAGIDSALRFADRHPQDPRATGVLTNAAEKLYAAGEGERAVGVAKQVLARDATPPQRRVAWTVVAFDAFDRGRFAEAEAGLREVLALVPAGDPQRASLGERLAAAVYKQGEAARADGRDRDAVGHFERIAALAPDSSVRAAAQVDAAAALITLKDWDGAARQLEDFRARFPNHPLAADVSTKLAAVHLERGQWSLAAAEFEKIAATQPDPRLARDALWQAAELHDKAAGPNGNRAAAARVYERWLKQYPDAPLEPAVEARWRLAEIAQAERNPARRLALLREAQRADATGGVARTPRTRTIGGLATLALAEPAADAYRAVKLVEPLARNLKLKKAKLEDVLRAYAQAGEYGDAEVTTAATFETAALYHDFGRAMLASQRPRGLKKAEREQYEVMLEEQAFPFEEKAIELHEINARRAPQGLWNDWVARSFRALAELRPVRWAKTERASGPLPGADAVATLERAVAAQPSAPGWNELGIALRHAGRFAQAREAYERALAADPNHVAATLNLGILHDLYLDEPERALELYGRAQTLMQGPDATVAKWIADLRNRKPAAAAVAKKEVS